MPVPSWIAEFPNRYPRLYKVWQTISAISAVHWFLTVGISMVATVVLLIRGIVTGPLLVVIYVGTAFGLAAIFAMRDRRRLSAAEPQTSSGPPSRSLPVSAQSSERHAVSDPRVDEALRTRAAELHAAIAVDSINAAVLEGHLLQGLAPAEHGSPSAPYLARLSSWHTKISEALASSPDLHALVDDAAVFDPPLPRWHARVIEAQMNALGGIVNSLRRQHGL